MDLSKLDTAFDEKADEEITYWKPTTVGELILGKVIECDIDATHNTPHFLLEREDKDDITVYVKTGLERALRTKKFLSNVNEWIYNLEQGSESIIGQYIAIRFEGKEKNPSTNRFFEKYKVIFQEELEKLGLVNVKLANKPKKKK